MVRLVTWFFVLVFATTMGVAGYWAADTELPLSTLMARVEYSAPPGGRASVVWSATVNRECQAIGVRRLIADDQIWALPTISVNYENEPTPYRIELREEVRIPPTVASEYVFLYTEFKYFCNPLHNSFFPLTSQAPLIRIPVGE